MADVLPAKGVEREGDREAGEEEEEGERMCEVGGGGREALDVRENGEKTRREGGRNV